LIEQDAKNNLIKVIKNGNEKIYVVKYEESIIAFFTSSMSVVCSKDLLNEGNGLKGLVYPVLLMGKIGIDQKHRCFGIGKYVCLFCLGLVRKTSEKITCTFFSFSKQPKHWSKKPTDQNIILNVKAPIGK
jgi:hypothetical protein